MPDKDPNDEMDDDLKDLEESYNLSELEEQQIIDDELYVSYLHGKIAGFLKASLIVNIVLSICFVFMSIVSIGLLYLLLS